MSALSWLRERLRRDRSALAPPLQLPLPEGVEFTPLAPDASSGALFCPVTRQPIGPGDRIFRCGACSTLYSAAGWAFVREADRGRCCGCGARGAVRPERVPPAAPEAPDGTA